MGPEGLVPAEALFGTLRSRGASFSVLPSLFWFVTPTDVVLRALSVVGGLLCLLSAWAPATPWLALPLGFLYLSFANAGMTFYSFQWDNLVVESLVLGLFLGPRGPGRVGLFLYWWLLLRLYVEGGLAKLLWSDDWTSGVAMGNYWHTAPLPAPLVHLAAALPREAQRLMTWGTLVVEILLPPLLFVGPRARAALFVLLTGLQVAILLTANYGVFNYISMVLGLSLLVPWPSWGRERRQAALALPLLLASLVVFAARFSRDTELFPESARTISRWRVANAYHLFARVDPERDELELLGSDDGQEWGRFPWRYKPPAPPALIAPYMPRVEFRLWFATLGNRDRPPGLVVQAPEYVERLMAIWCTEPERLEALAAGPVTAPVWVSLGFRRLTLNDGEWVVEELGRHPAIWRCGEGSPKFPQVRSLLPLDLGG